VKPNAPTPNALASLAEALDVTVGVAILLVPPLTIAVPGVILFLVLPVAALLVVAGRRGGRRGRDPRAAVRERHASGPRLVIGTSVGALNAAFLVAASDQPAAEVGAEGKRIWRDVRYGQVLSRLGVGARAGPGTCLSGRAARAAGASDEPYSTPSL
jgi:hypothetical protein